MTQTAERNWWGRNWRWVVPVGCLGFPAMMASFIAVVVYLVFGMMKMSDAYKEPVAFAKANPSLQSAIGTPLEEGLFVTGTINVSGPSGEADPAIPLSGPEGKATLYVVAEKSAGQWTCSTLVVEIREIGQRIDLSR